MYNISSPYDVRFFENWGSQTFFEKFEKNSPKLHFLAELLKKCYDAQLHYVGYLCIKCQAPTTSGSMRSGVHNFFLKNLKRNSPRLHFLADLKNNVTLHNYTM